MISRWASLVIALAETLFIVFFVRSTNGATIGDGTKSLYTGNPINPNNTRGSCVADGVRYMSETAIPRDHPCHYCICYQSQVTCYWKQCAAAPEDCEVMMFENVCNPSLYVCDIPEKTRSEPEFGTRLELEPPRRKRKVLIRRTKILPSSKRIRREARSLKMPVEEGFPVEFEKAWNEFQSRSVRRRRAIRFADDGPYNHLLRDTSCFIFGVRYNLGDVIGVASDVCMECRCAAGVMFCSPKCCFLPSPFSVGTSGGNAIFVRGRNWDTANQKPPHPLHPVRNQFVEGGFL